MVNESVIVENYERFMEIIGQDDRSEQLEAMYSDFGNELAEAPASGYRHYHNAFLGGYLDHVLRVHDMSIQQAKLLKEFGGELNFTAQELKFAALHHDLGKLGEPGSPYYIVEDSDWHRTKLGRLYKHNEMQYMSVTDRALFLLQHYGVTVTRNEWLAISLSDGMYDKANAAYLKNNMYPYPMRTNLPYVIHVADYLATAVERDKSRPKAVDLSVFD